jgi:hypothetical protein
LADFDHIISSDTKLIPVLPSELLKFGLSDRPSQKSHENQP